jgi:hypothetical protein
VKERQERGREKGTRKERMRKGRKKDVSKRMQQQ